MPARNLRICQQAAFLNSLPSKFSLATTVLFSLTLKFHWTEKEKERKGGVPYTPKHQVFIFYFC